MQAKMLYVVIVETGEYSDRHDWVGGVFDDRETAQLMIVEKSAAAREQAARYDVWQRKQRDIRIRFYQMQPGGHSYDPKLMAAIEREAGPAPNGELGDQFYLVEVPLNQWGQFIFAGYERVDTGYPCGRVSENDVQD